MRERDRETEKESEERYNGVKERPSRNDKRNCEGRQIEKVYENMIKAHFSNFLLLVGRLERRQDMEFFLS